MKRKRYNVLVIMATLLFFLLAACLAVGCGSKGGESKDWEGNSGAIGGENVERVCQANLRTIDGAVQTYFTQNGSYPKSINDLVPTFLRSVPVEPAGGTYSLEGNPPKAVCSKGHKLQ